MNTSFEQSIPTRVLNSGQNHSLLVDSAVSWGAIFAGAAGAAALSLILLILGTGLGFSAISPWAHSGVTATTLGVSTILWITITQLIAAALGGFLAGRLRTKWVAVHKDEIHFRDTAHGFLAWCVATLATASLLTSIVGSIVSGGVHASAVATGTIANSAMTTAAQGVASNRAEKSENGEMGYFIDMLFRKDASVAPAATNTHAVTHDDGSSTSSVPTASAPEATRIFANAIQTGSLSADDTHYIGQLVAQRTGLTQQEAEQRVTDVYARLQNKLRDAEMTAKQAADQARKATAYASLWLFISLLIGAFFAALAATYGGRQRDLELPV